MSGRQGELGRGWTDLKGQQAVLCGLHRRYGCQGLLDCMPNVLGGRIFGDVAMLRAEIVKHFQKDTEDSQPDHVEEIRDKTAVHTAFD